MYPLIGLDPGDVREAFASIKTKDKDEWAAAFMASGRQYDERSESLGKADPAKANADYIRAWRLYSFGRWPIPASPGKQRSYEKAIQAFLAHATLLGSATGVVKIPFEGSQIIAYLRLPKNAKGPVPLVIAVNGLDSRKEDLSESFCAILPYGVGFLAVDGPGTGQAPIKASETGRAHVVAVLDYAQLARDRRRPDRHPWSELGRVLGHEACDRGAFPIKGASAQSPPIDKFFQKEFPDELTSREP